MKHTPGPWRVETYGNWPRIFAEDWQIAEVIGFSPSTRKANAKLMSFAPYLLYAMQQAADRIDKLVSVSHPEAAETQVLESTSTDLKRAIADAIIE